MVTKLAELYSVAALIKCNSLPSVPLKVTVLGVAGLKIDILLS